MVILSKSGKPLVQILFYGFTENVGIRVSRTSMFAENDDLAF